MEEYLEAETCNAQRVLAVRQRGEQPARGGGASPKCIAQVGGVALPRRLRPAGAAAAEELGPRAALALGRRQQLGRESEGGDPRCLAAKLAEGAGGRATSPGGLFSGPGYL
jgi:hypothetical protein